MWICVPVLSQWWEGPAHLQVPGECRGCQRTHYTWQENRANRSWDQDEVPRPTWCAWMESRQEIRVEWRANKWFLFWGFVVRLCWLLIAPKNVHNWTLNAYQRQWELQLESGAQRHHWRPFSQVATHITIPKVLTVLSMVTFVCQCEGQHTHSILTTPSLQQRSELNAFGVYCS